MTESEFEYEMGERLRRAAEFAADTAGTPEGDLGAPAGGGSRRTSPTMLFAGVVVILLIAVIGSIVVLRGDTAEVVTTDVPIPETTSTPPVADTAAPEDVASPPTSTAAPITTGPTTTGLEAVPASDCDAAVSPPQEVKDLGPVSAFPSMELLAFGRDGSAVVQAYVDGVYTEPVELPGILNPDSLRLFGSFDLNADGVAEILLDGLGNTARIVVILQTDGCDLVPVLGEDTRGDVFRLLIGVGGNSCAPTGCPVRVRCVGDELETSLLEPDESIRGQLVPLSEAPVVVTTVRYRLVPGLLDLLSEETVMYPTLDDAPEDAPSFGEGDVVNCPAGTPDATTTTQAPSVSAPPSLAPGVSEAAEAVVRDFLTDLRNGDLESAAGRWTGYPDASGPNTSVVDRVALIETLLSDPEFASILEADFETFVNASWGWTYASPVVTVFARADEQRPAGAAGFLVGFSDGQGEPGQMWIQRLPTAINRWGEIKSIVEPGGQVTLPGVPVEGGARAYLNETEIPVVVDHSNLTTSIAIPDTAEGTVAITLSTATPELSAAQAFVLTIVAP